MNYKGAKIPIHTRIGVQDEKNGSKTGYKLALLIDNQWYHAERILKGPDRHWKLTKIKRADALLLYTDTRGNCYLDH